MDGARADVFGQLLEAGDLPNLSRHVLEPGGFAVGTTVFPSVTLVAHIPFLFGRYPGPVGVPGLRWLDRAGAAGNWRAQYRATRSYCGAQAEWVNHDLAPAEGMFSLVPGSLAINTGITHGLRPGAHLLARRRTRLGTLAHFTGDYASFDDAVAGAWLAAAQEPWRFLYVVLSGIDGAAHHHHPFHPTTLEAYRRADRALGAFMERTSRNGEVPLVVVASDHGLSPITGHWDLAEELERIGLPTVRHPVHVWRRRARAAVMVSGNASAHLYVEPRSGRRAPRTTADLPTEMLEWIRSQPAVDLAAWRDDDGGLMVARGGQLARVATVGTAVTYRAVSGDPLGLGLGSICLEDRAMLRRSRTTSYPDAPRQLLQLFGSSRTGDIVLSAASGWDFRGPWEIPEHRAGHGSLLRENMEVPIAASVPLGSAPVRTVDLMPFMLDHLEVPLPLHLDGETPAHLRGAQLKAV